MQAVCNISTLCVCVCVQEKMKEKRGGKNSVQWCLKKKNPIQFHIETMAIVINPPM